MEHTDIWQVIEKDDYATYDAFVDLIKNHYSGNDDEKAYAIEDIINDCVLDMFTKIENFVNNK